MLIFGFYTLELGLLGAHGTDNFDIWFHTVCVKVLKFSNFLGS